MNEAGKAYSSAKLRRTPPVTAPSDPDSEGR